MHEFRLPPVPDAAGDPPVSLAAMNTGQADGDVFSSPLYHRLDRDHNAERAPETEEAASTPSSSGWGYLSFANMVR